MKPGLATTVLYIYILAYLMGLRPKNFDFDMCLFVVCNNNVFEKELEIENVEESF